MERAGVLRMPAQHIARKALSFVWLTSIDSGPTTIESLVSRSCGRFVCVLVVVHARPASFHRHRVAAYPNAG
jgi:hypothetical protein